MELMIKYVSKFERFDVEDFGLKPSDCDSHCPSLYVIRKSLTTSHADRHQRSEAGKKHDAERRKLKKKETKKRRTE